MKVFISGVCGFVGSKLALGLLRSGHEVSGCDNFIRPGSERNLPLLEAAGVEVWRGDVRFEKDLERAGGMSWIVDAAANPSVLAGVDGMTSSRELLEHNLWGTVNLLETCRREGAGMILLSTSRVYSIEALCALPLKVKGEAFVMEESGGSFSPSGIMEEFSTNAPISFYGASKLASEQIALEYGAAFDFPVWINRCGVMAGAGQFGRADQGIFSYWIHSWARGAPLKYIGFDGMGHQVRDCLHPEDLLDLVLKQMMFPAQGEGGRRPRILNVGGGAASAMSLRELSSWCTAEFGPRDVIADLTSRPFDLPWVVLDSSRSGEIWRWKPRRTVRDICSEIARHARENPDWLDICSGRR